MTVSWVWVLLAGATLGMHLLVTVHSRTRHGRATACTPPAPARYLAAVEVAFSRRLSHDWQDLANVVGTPGFHRPRFARGDEARAVWEWLEVRNRLGELPAALEEIGRTDLADLRSFA